MNSHFQRINDFCKKFGLRSPILLAPMAGVPAPALSIAIANCGGLGACGALLMTPESIITWVKEFKRSSDGPFQLNLWIPDPPPLRDPEHELKVRQYLSKRGPPVRETAGDVLPPDFSLQCDALIEANPPMVSSVMGLYPPQFVKRLKQAGIIWIANVSTVSEAIEAEAAGADIVVAQGAEAGGHRGCFLDANAESQLIGLFSLLPNIVDAVNIPVVATGGIADARGVAAAIMLGASAVQVGTGFLRTPEANLPHAWADALAQTTPERTVLTRAFSGRLGRSIVNQYVKSSMQRDAPEPSPYPVQRGLTLAMRNDAIANNDLERMQAWAGQSAKLALALPATEVFERLREGLPKNS